MSILIIPEKKYCPSCYWTCKTMETHCPMSASNPIFHEFRLIPLEVCKPDTSNEHKWMRSQSKPPYQVDPIRAKRIQKERRVIPEVMNVPLSRIRNYQNLVNIVRER